MPSALFLFVFSFAMLGMEARDLHMLGKYHTTKQYLPLCFCCLYFVFILSIYMFVLSVSVCLSIYLCVSCLSVFVCVCVCVSVRSEVVGMGCPVILGFFSFETRYFLETGTHGTSPSPTWLQGQRLVPYMTSRIYILLLMTESRCSINRRAIPPAPFFLKIVL